MYNVATKTVRDGWNSYLENRPHVIRESIEDVIQECVEVEDYSKLDRELHGGAKAFFHPEIKTHFFLAKEADGCDERVFIAMTPFNSNARVAVANANPYTGKLVPRIGVLPSDLFDRVLFYKSYLKELDDWLSGNKNHEDRDRVVIVKNRVICEMQECRLATGTNLTRFTNDRGKLQYEEAITFLLKEVGVLSDEIKTLKENVSHV